MATPLPADAASSAPKGPRRLDLFDPGAIAAGASTRAPPEQRVSTSPASGALGIDAHDLTAADLTHDLAEDHAARRLQRALTTAFTPGAGEVRSPAEKVTAEYLFFLPQIPAFTRALVTGCWNGAGCPDVPVDMSLLTIVAVEHDTNGRPASWQVVLSSGSRGFDADAVAAVRHVVSDTTAVEAPSHAALLWTRWAFGAQLAAALAEEGRGPVLVRRVRLVAFEYRK